MVNNKSLQRVSIMYTLYVFKIFNYYTFYVYEYMSLCQTYLKYDLNTFTTKWLM